MDQLTLNKELQKRTFELQRMVDTLVGQINIQIDLNKELNSRIRRLETFITKEDQDWSDKEAMLGKGNLQETIVEVVKDNIWIDGPVTGQNLRSD